MNKPLIILDRDGIINQDSPYYIKSPDEFIMIPDSAAAIARLTAAGFQIAVATNQSGIARGYYDEKILAAIHAKMIAAVEAAGGRIDNIQYCPHMPDFGCQCRKPKPGMLQAIATFFNCSLEGVPFVGDRVSDIKAALAVGARPLLVMTPMTDKVDLSKAYPEVPVYTSLATSVDALLGK